MQRKLPKSDLVN